MNKKVFLMACLPLVLPACQSISSHNTPPNIENYTWQNAENNIALHFSAQHRLHIETACNGQNTTWSLQNNMLKTSALMSTMKMCAPAQMQKEKVAQTLFDQASLKIDINMQTRPILTLTDAKGQQFQFIGQLTPEAQYHSQPEMVFFEVAPQTSAEPLKVRQVKYNDVGVKTLTEQDWHIVKIDGYMPTPNTHNIIRVKGFNLNSNNPVYIYDMTIEQSL